MRQQNYSVFKKIIDKSPLPSMTRKPVFFGWTLVQDLKRCDLMKQASAMAYVTLLSLVPSLAAIFCIVSLFTPIIGEGSSFEQTIKDFVLSNLAASTGETAIAYIDKLLGNLNLSKLGWSSFAGLLVTLTLLLRQIELALNRIWMLRKERNVITRFIYFWTFLTLGLVVLAIIFGLSSDYAIINKATSEVQRSGGGLLDSFIRWVGGAVFFFFLYKVVPNCFITAKAAFIGAAISSLLLAQAGKLYGVFINSFSNYQSIYGALAAIPLFLMWLYICWLIILLGSVISWRMQQGFPHEEDQQTLDTIKSPVEQYRNNQLKSLMPLICLLAIYRKFQEADGKGLSTQEMQHSMRELPMGWIVDAVETLESLSYVVSAKDREEEEIDVYYPAFPADALQVSKIQQDLSGPAHEWVSHWEHDLPLDMAKILQAFTGPDQKTIANLNLAQALPTFC